jgi:flagellar assembly protein FliH
MEKLTGNYRRHRFHPLNILEAQERGKQDPYQQRYEEGFRQGEERGFEQGLVDGHSQGKAQGYEAGFREGEIKGMQAGRQDFDAVLAPLESIQKALEELHQRELGEHTNNLCMLVEQVARRVIHAELSLNPTQLTKLVEDAIGRLHPTREPIAVYLSPDDHQRLATIGTTKIGDYPILTDESLSIGDCRLESESQHLTVRSEERLTNCIEKVREELEQES